MLLSWYQKTSQLVNTLLSFSSQYDLLRTALISALSILQKPYGEIFSYCRILIGRIRCNFWQSFKKFCTCGSEPPYHFRKVKVTLNLVYRIFLNLPKVASYPAYQNSTEIKNFTVPFSKYKRLKLKLGVFLAGYSVAMVAYCVTNVILPY